jgi:hypothetical protein
MQDPTVSIEFFLNASVAGEAAGSDSGAVLPVPAPYLEGVSVVGR